jgi:diguanylate cyclase (GGDEF)-like protein/PAS domain S-box-containing protein
VKIPAIEQSARFWARPDFQSLAFGRQGEVLAARVRLWVTALVVLIPLATVLFRPPEAEARIGLAAAVTVFALGAFVLWLAHRETPPAWLSLFTCLLDVSLISCVNAGFVLSGNPLAATNSRVVFCCYFVALALACLRQDWRWCLAATLAAMAQYGGIVLWAAARYDLGGPAFALSGYGKFKWDNQASRLLLLALAGAVCVVIVRQSRGYRKAAIQSFDSEERFRALLEAAPDAMVIVDRSGVIVLVNTQTEKLFGYLRAELTGQPVEMLISEELRESHVGHRATFHAEHRARAMGSGLELYARRKDGGIFPVEVSLSPLEIEQGSLVSSTIRDVTERRRLEYELREANAELSRLADLDALTGLANRRLFDRRLVAEWSRAARLNRHLRFPVALVLLDVDHFKAFNDQYGHLAGDACLRRVAEALSAATHREGDLAARFGGEEFAFLLPGTDEDGAWTIAEAVRREIEGLAIQHGAPGAGPTLTISAGVAALTPLPDMVPDQLVQAADLALYSAKALGRNRAARPPAA